MNNDKWTRILRPFVVVACAIALYVSALFSVDGFNFQIPEKQWIGWALAFLIIIFEMAWTRAGDNLTLFCVGIFCYAYGLTTNVLGIMSYRGPVDGWTDYLLPVVFGAFLEIAPEPFLAWAIGGDTSSDPIGRIIRRLFGEGISPSTGYLSPEVRKVLGTQKRRL